MELQPLTLFSLLLATLALGLAIWALGQARSEQRRLAQSQAAMQNDLRALCNAAVGVGDRVHQIEHQLRQLAQRQEELGQRQELMDMGDDGRSFQQAVKMAHKGASVEELMEICGLGRGEAELITMLHRLEG